MRIYRQFLKTQGFTLIEALISLAVLCLVISIIPLSIQTMKDTDQHLLNNPKTMLSQLQPMEVSLFFQSIGRNIRSSSSVHVSKESPATLTIMKPDGTKLQIQTYNNMIRRKKNGKGHVALLYRVDRMMLKKLKKGVRITIIGKKGHRYERIFVPRSKKLS